MKRARLTLDAAEVEAAIKQYISNNIYPRLVCVGNVELLKRDFNVTQASVDVEPAIIDPFEAIEGNIHYKLRHRESKLFVESVNLSIEKKKVVFGVGMLGCQWDTIPAIFNNLKKIILKKNFNGVPECDPVALEQLKEDLLLFEIVYFGETKVDDMTFHINELGKMK